MEGDDIIDSGGFRFLLERAIRIDSCEDGNNDNSVDWSVHCVDYNLFKQRLRLFAQRRSAVLGQIEASHDDRIPDSAIPELAPTSHIHKLATNTDYFAMDDNGSISSAESGSQRRRNKRYIMRRFSIQERDEITLFLAYEMDKVAMFYMAHWQKLSTRLEKLQQQDEKPQEQLSSSPTDAEYLALGDEILELFAFCAINLVATHQILIRYDAFARTFEGTPMHSYYLKQVEDHPTSFRKIWNHDEVKAIADAFVNLVGNRLGRSMAEDDGSRETYATQFRAQRSMFVDILRSLEGPSAKMYLHKGRIKWTNSLKAIGRWILVGLFEDRLHLEPAYLTGRGKSLTDQMEQLALWRKKKREIVRPIKVEKKLTKMQKYNLTLNLLSAFLYCMNYYIVEPSSTLYCNRLGAHDTMSGTLIGMTPLAAFLSSIPYSMWTNNSFRNPFLISCLMLVLGNMLYSMADIFQSFPMALMGRFVCGLGAPKCIIRRYMADTTPLSLRTSVNAGFGMVVAAGSAMGPAMAVVLTNYKLVVRVPDFAYVNLNGLTLPGYFMAALWTTFTLVVFASFEEPTREGLLEQQEMEESARMNKTGKVTRPQPKQIIDMVPSAPPLSSPTPSTENDLVSLFSNESNHQIATMPVKSRGSSANYWQTLKEFMELVTLPVRICLCLLFAKVFTIETLVSATSSLTKNRYRWVVQQVGVLGFTNGILVIPFSILVGKLSLSFADRLLMRWLVIGGCVGFFLVIDLSDLLEAPTGEYNKGHILAVTPQRYVVGYYLSCLCIQAFEGVIGSSLSKVIPTALASGTFNSGLLATLVDTFGRTCGDIFITVVGFINLRQLMNLLFIPGFVIMFSCLVVIEKFQDILSV